MAIHARPATKMFDTLANIEQELENELGECNAPYRSEERKSYMVKFFTAAIEKLNAHPKIEKKDITQRLLDMLENENYHRMYAVCEIWTDKSTIEHEAYLFG